MSVFTGFVIVLALIGGVGGILFYFRRKTKVQVQEAVKSLGELPPDMAPVPPKTNHTLESAGVDLPNKEGDKPKGNSDSTESSDESTEPAPSSNIENLPKEIEKIEPIVEVEPMVETEPIPEIEPKEQIEDQEILNIRAEAELKIKELAKRKEIDAIEIEEKEAIKKIKKEMADKKKATQK